MVDVREAIRSTWGAPEKMASSVVNTFSNWPSIVKIIGVLSIIFGVIIGLGSVIGLIKLSLWMSATANTPFVWCPLGMIDLGFLFVFGVVSSVFAGAGYKMLQFKAKEVTGPREDKEANL